MKRFASIIPRRDVTAFSSVLGAVPMWLSASGSVERLEREFVRRYGYLGAFAVNSGRDGLRMLLRAIRGSVPDLAWVPAWTISDVPAIFEQEGFEVRYIDTDPATLSLTPQIVMATCTDPGLLLVTHYFGLPADMNSIRHVAAARGLKIVEDCAHAPGALADGSPVGSFGTGGFLSFETRKPLNGLGGGMVVTNHDSTFDALSAVEPLPERGAAADLMKVVMTSSEWLMLRRKPFFVASKLLYSDSARRYLIGAYRKAHATSRGSRVAFSDRQAISVLAQLDGLNAMIDRKAAVAAVYDRMLPSIFSRPLNPESRPHGYYMYVTTHPDAERVGRRMREMGIDCGIGPEVLGMCGDPTTCPGAARLSETAIELPIYASLTIDDAETVCRVAAAAIG